MFMQGPWSQMEEADIKAVAKFIKQLPAVKNKVPASNFKPKGPPPGAPGGAGGPPPGGTAGSAAAGSAGSAAAGTTK